MNRITFILLLSLIAGLFSCEKMIEVKPPVTEATAQQVFENNEMALSAASGVYLKLKAGFTEIFNGGTTILTGLSSDEIGNNFSGSDLDLFERNELNQFEESNLYNKLWIPAYSSIYHANSVIKGLERSTGIDDKVKSQLKGEMLAIRALGYFYLINLFGNVPLILTTDFSNNRKLPSSSYETVMEALSNDLLEARDLLSIQDSPNKNTRINKLAASALLARAYLYQKNWKEAEYFSSEVINSGMYDLEAIEKVFLATSKETIWALQSISAVGYNTSEGVSFLPYDEYSVPSFFIKKDLLSAFEPGDVRKIQWLGINAVADTIYYPNKYKKGYAEEITENYVVLRLSEQYLIRAEAYAQLNSPDKASDDLNYVRNRAQLSRIEGLNKQQLIDAILDERKIELFAEWGHRWFDLKRSGKTDEIIGKDNPNWQSTDALYPIPYSEIKLNPNLAQNPGYN